MKRKFKNEAFLFILLVLIAISLFSCKIKCECESEKCECEECEECPPVCIDRDYDGFGENCAPGPDCDDNNPSVYPNAPEFCDGIDNQCSGDAGYGQVDEGCSWSNTYGGSADEVAHFIQPLFQYYDGVFEPGLCDGNSADGDYCDIMPPYDSPHYIVCGYTSSYGAGSEDIWVLKLDFLGNVVWKKSLGGSLSDRAYSLAQSWDGTFILAGNTYSFGSGSADFWVVKLTSNGDKIWDKTFGGPNFDSAYSILKSYEGPVPLDTTEARENGVPYYEGSYIVLGETESYGGGSKDIWVLKLDSSGNKIWDKTFGGLGDDGAYSIQMSYDNGYIIAGYTTATGALSKDVWVIKLNAEGNKVWDKVFGGNYDDVAYSLVQSFDGYVERQDVPPIYRPGYVVVGYTSSYGAGGKDIWVLKLNEEGNKIWEKNFGGAGNEEARAIQYSYDGYIVVGSTNSYGAGLSDIWFLKLDSMGNRIWDKTFGGPKDEYGYSVAINYNGGYIVAGSSASFGEGGNDFFVLKLDPNGNCAGAGCK